MEAGYRNNGARGWGRGMYMSGKNVQTHYLLYHYYARFASFLAASSCNLPPQCAFCAFEPGPFLRIIDTS